MLDDGSSLIGRTGGWPDTTRGVEARYLFGVASLLRHRTLVGLCGAAGVMLGVLFVLAKPVTYTASTQLMVYSRELHPGPEPVISPGRADLVLVENMIEIFRSRGVLTKVVETLGLADDAEFASGSAVWHQVANWVPGGPSAATDGSRAAMERALDGLRKRLTVYRVGTSHTILVGITSLDPHKAALIANEFARSAPQVLASADSGFSRTPLLRERLQGLGPTTYVISTADPPVHADGPRRIVVLVLGAGAGLFIGALLALVLDLLDRTIRTSQQLQDELGIECLGVVPRLPDSARANKHPEADAPGAAGGDLVAPPLQERAGAILDRTLRRTRVMIGPVLNLRWVGVTSSAPGEGASTVAAHLALSAARCGRKVLFVNAAGNGPMSPLPEAPEATRDAPEAPDGARRFRAQSNGDGRGGFDVCFVGGLRVNATDAAWSQRLDEVLSDATGCYDLVVVDLPALASGPQVQIAGDKLDGLLLVVKWAADDADLLRRRLDLSGAARAKFFGAVLNMAEARLIGKYGDKFAGAEAALSARRLAAAGVSGDLPTILVPGQ